MAVAVPEVATGCPKPLCGQYQVHARRHGRGHGEKSGRSSCTSLGKTDLVNHAQKGASSSTQSVRSGVQLLEHASHRQGSQVRKGGNQ